MAANDEQHGGSHYKTQAVQVWDYVTSNGIPYLEGNVIKYVSRWRAKGGLEDLLKARHYLDKIIENEKARLAAAPQPPDPAPGIERFFEGEEAPPDYYHNHHPECGVRYRGCHPSLCPKDQYERTGVWRTADQLVAPAPQEVRIGKGGLCRCSCGNPCPLGKTGMETRCTPSELIGRSDVTVTYQSEETAK